MSLNETLTSDLPKLRELEFDPAGMFIHDVKDLRILDALPETVNLEHAEENNLPAIQVTLEDGDSIPVEEYIKLLHTSMELPCLSAFTIFFDENSYFCIDSNTTEMDIYSVMKIYF